MTAAGAGVATGSGAIAEAAGAAAALATGAGVAIEVPAFPVAEGSATAAPAVSTVTRPSRAAHRRFTARMWIIWSKYPVRASFRPGTDVTETHFRHAGSHIVQMPASTKLKKRAAHTIESLGAMANRFSARRLAYGSGSLAQRHREKYDTPITERRFAQGSYGMLTCRCGIEPFPGWFGDSVFRGKMGALLSSNAQNA